MHLTKDDVAGIQQALSDKGLFNGEIDGEISDALITSYKTFAYQSGEVYPLFPSNVEGINPKLHAEPQAPIEPTDDTDAEVEEDVEDKVDQGPMDEEAEVEDAEDEVDAE